MFREPRISENCKCGKPRRPGQRYCRSCHKAAQQKYRDTHVVMGRYCIPCGTKGKDVDAAVVIDGDPMCAHCARGEGHQMAVAADAPLEERVDAAVQAVVRETEFAQIHRRLESRNRNPPAVPCPHGCGRPKHRALCRGASRPKVMTGAKCAHPDCKRRVRKDNRSGVCFEHNNWSRSPEGVAFLGRQQRAA
jgi:hypothetical protein